MNSVARITNVSIKAMSGISKKPVYFLTMQGQNKPTITVKGENKADRDTITIADTEIAIKWSSKLMKNVSDSQVNTKIMEPTEVHIFKTKARELLVREPDKLLPLSIGGLIWVKMPYVNDLSNADLFFKNKNNNWETAVKGIKDLFRRFSYPNTWIQLGRILAVDIFDGNWDRFNSSGGWDNNGNVMFQKAANGYRVTGLDTFDVKNTPDTNLNQPLSPQVQQHLQILMSDIRMREYATNVTTEIAGFILKAMGNAVGGGIDDFKMKAGGRKITITRKGEPDFFYGYIDDLCTGLKEGRDEIKRYLLEKVRQYDSQWIPTSRSLSTPRSTGFSMGSNKHSDIAVKTSAPAGFTTPSSLKTIPQGITDRMRYFRWIV